MTYVVSKFKITGNYARLETNLGVVYLTKTETPGEVIAETYTEDSLRECSKLLFNESIADCARKLCVLQGHQFIKPDVNQNIPKRRNKRGRK